MSLRSPGSGPAITSPLTDEDTRLLAQRIMRSQQAKGELHLFGNFLGVGLQILLA
jgi:hypothetical protein